MIVISLLTYGLGEDLQLANVVTQVQVTKIDIYFIVKSF